MRARARAAYRCIGAKKKIAVPNPQRYAIIMLSLFAWSQRNSSLQWYRHCTLSQNISQSLASIALPPKKTHNVSISPGHRPEEVLSGTVNCGASMDLLWCFKRNRNLECHANEQNWLLKNQRDVLIEMSAIAATRAAHRLRVSANMLFVNQLLAGRRTLSARSTLV